MKIAHVISTFYPRQGGMGVVVFDEARELVKRGHSVSVFTMRYGADEKVETKDGVRIERIQSVVRLGDGGVVWFGDRFKDFDLVHLHLPWYGAGLLFYLGIRKFNKPYVVTMHMEGQVSGIKKTFKEIGERYFLEKILKNAKKVFLVNKDYFAYSSYLKNLPSEKVVELPNAVDTSLFSPGIKNPEIFRDLISETSIRDSSTRLGMTVGESGFKDDSKRVILFVGNLMPVKRLDLLLRAIAGGESNWRLAVVGAGYAEEEYKKLAHDLGIKEKVKFVGSVEREKLPEFYRTVDCVVVPSASESFSLVAAEALACGTRTVVSSVNGASEMEKNGAVIFESGNVADLILKIRDTLSNDNVFKGKMILGISEHVDALEKFYK